MIYRNFLMILMSLLFLASCDSMVRSNFDFPTSDLPPKEIIVKNYGQALFEADTNRLQETLKRIQPDFMPFLDADLDDSANINRIRSFVADTLLRRLYKVSTETFSGINDPRNSMTDAFRRYHKHFPEAPIPEIYLYISGVQFEAPVMVSENAAAIALDCYLGIDFSYYRQLGIPFYRISRMTPGHLINDIFGGVYEAYVEPEQQTKTILDEMIKAGKRLYFLEAMQPDTDDQLIIGYTSEQLEWVNQHEGELWAFFVGEQVLYSSDFLMFRKLFGDGPFTQDFSEKAPARLGEWVGWQIVRKYARQHSGLSLSEIIAITDSQSILAGSKYKPKK
ncbi:MAG: hypothetical protein Q8S18_09990 [Bacteroidales bacterium]|nr:hypothetical protein [Bacteroidales bacterium]